MSIEAKSAIKNVAPYKQGQSEIDGVADPIKLSSNELPYPPSPAAVKALVEAPVNIGRYPDGSQKQLRAAIAKQFGIPSENIFAGNGSEEALGLIVRSVLAPGDNIVVSENSFVMTEIYARSCGADVVKVGEVDFRVDIDAVLDRVNSGTKIVYLCSPNNPTGTYLTKSEIARLNVELPDDVLLLLDAAYAEFVTADDYDCGIATLFLPAGRVAVTHTFSKAYGLAGQRIGWAAVPNQIADAVSRLRTPFNTNAPALAAATAAIKDQNYLRVTSAKIVETREWFAEEMRLLGINTVPSQTNFVLLTFPEGGNEASLLDQELQRNGILARPVTGTANELRFSIGTQEEMQSARDVVASWWARRKDGDE